MFREHVPSNRGTSLYDDFNASTSTKSTRTATFGTTPISTGSPFQSDDPAAPHFPAPPGHWCQKNETSQTCFYRFCRIDKSRDTCVEFLCRQAKSPDSCLASTPIRQHRQRKTPRRQQQITQRPQKLTRHHCQMRYGLSFL